MKVTFKSTFARLYVGTTYFKLQRSDDGGPYRDCNSDGRPVYNVTLYHEKRANELVTELTENWSNL